MKKIISILICIQITLFPALALASANVAGWTLGNPVAQGASAVVNGTKTAIINGASVIKNSSAKITPPATSVAKVLAKGAAGYALSVAVEQLIGSVDWVLDPANNAISYTIPSDAPINTFPKAWYQRTSFSNQTGCSGYFSSSSQAVDKFIQCANKAYSTFAGSHSCSALSSTEYQCFVKYGDPNYYFSNYRITYVNNPSYDPSLEKPEDERKSIPLDTVAQKVISNAASGDARAQQAIVAAAQDIINEAETDNTKARPIVNQLEANAETATDETATGEAVPKADPVTGAQSPPLDLSLEFPVFCGWAPLVCEAAQTVITFPNTLTEWWIEAKEWITGEPDLQEDQTELPIEEQTLDRDPSSFDTDYIVLGSQCPSFEPYTVEVGPISKTLSMDLSPLCDFAAQVRPAILGMSYLTAAGIVVAAIRET